MKKEVKKQAKKNRKYTNQDKALLSTFVILAILVIILIVIALNMKNIVNEEKVNITIPVLEVNSQNEISIDISEMKVGEIKNYNFKIANYKDSNVNNEEISYDISIIASENVTIELYKNDSNKNIIKDNNLIIENNKLPKDKKKEENYRLAIKAKKQVLNNENITLKINS